MTAHYAELADRYSDLDLDVRAEAGDRPAGPPYRRILDRLVAGEPIEVYRFQLPRPMRSRIRTDRAVLTPDGALVPIIEPTELADTTVVSDERRP